MRSRRNPEKRHLALERAGPFGLQAEFDDSLLFKLLMPREPHFTETALAERALQLPLRIGHGLSGGRPPADHRFIGRAAKAVRFFRIFWGASVARPVFADFADFHRLLDTFQLVVAVVQPAERANFGNLEAPQDLACAVEGKTREQDLIGATE